MLRQMEVIFEKLVRILVVGFVHSTLELRECHFLKRITCLQMILKIISGGQVTL